MRCGTRSTRVYCARPEPAGTSPVRIRRCGSPGHQAEALDGDFCSERPGIGAGLYDPVIVHQQYPADGVDASEVLKGRIQNIHVPGSHGVREACLNDGTDRVSQDFELFLASETCPVIKREDTAATTRRMIIVPMLSFLLIFMVTLFRLPSGFVTAVDYCATLECFCK